MCSYVFPVEPPPGAGEHPWQIRTVEDLLFTAPDLATLRAWITEGRLHPDDEVSRTGRHWIRLGDMPEFSSAFTGFSDLPAVFEPLEAEPPPAGSALEQLGPPPGFGETMPVIQGVDTDILVVRPVTISDFEVPVTARRAAVERALERPDDAAPQPVPLEDTSGPMPFPLGELPIHDDDDDDELPPADESAARMRPRPRPYSPPARVSAIPDVVEDAPVEPMRRRHSRPTVRYGAEEVHGAPPTPPPPPPAASKHDAVPAEDDDAVPPSDELPVSSASAAVEWFAEQGGRDYEPPSRSDGGPRGERSRPDDEPRRRSRRPERDFDERPTEQSRRRHRTFAREVGKPARRTWPLVAGLGLLAGVVVVFGVPSIRTWVLERAGALTAPERFDPASLAELAQARSAVTSLDPVALGEAEAALQGRLDEGQVPPPGVAEMKLAQVELLATRALDQAVGVAVGMPVPSPASDDVERATRILAGVVAEDVVDRAHMRRVRARLRLAQGRPAAEILPLLPPDGSGELRQLVAAASLWRDPAAPLPDGVIAGLEALPERSGLADLVLGVAYLRGGDRAEAMTQAEVVLARAPQQPTAIALRERAQGVASAGPADPTADSGAAEGGSTPAPDGAPTTDEGKATGEAPAGKDAPAGTDAPTKPAKPELPVDDLIEKGCNEVESGNVGAGLDLLRKAKSRRPGDLDMLLCTGQGHAKQGNTQKALKAYEAALRRSPSFASALREAAAAADQLGDTDKALRYYRRLLGQRPGDAKAKAYIAAHG